ncbi:MAG: hypothetical protein K9M45_10585 [Kiritimatiellales bacterium]|nr:hypothetical protein [Kiritimatiellales bacterium]
MARLIRMVCLVTLTILLVFTANKLRWMLIVRGFIPGGNVRTVQLTDKTMIKGKLAQVFWVAWDNQDIYVPSSNRLTLPRTIWQTLSPGDQLQIVTFSDGVPHLRGDHVADRQLVLHALLISVLVALLTKLLYFELKSQRLRKIMGSRLAAAKEEARNEAKGFNTTSIYSVPETKEQWGGRRTSRSSPRTGSRKHHRG